MQTEAVVYNNRDNGFGLRIYENGSRRVDLSALTRCVVKLRSATADATLDSDINPSYFNTAYNDPDGLDVILCKWGFAGLAEGVYTATVIYFDPLNTNGVVATQSLTVRVEDE